MIHTRLARFTERSILLALCGWSVLAARGQVQTNWAVWATASSQFHRNAWSAAQATGVPDVAGCGDSPHAWSPRFGGFPEWLELSFGTPRQALGLAAHETYSGGFVYQVDLIDVDGAYHTVWASNSTTQDTTPCGGWLAVNVSLTDYLVRGAKIYTCNAYDYVEIDAVGLLSPAAAGAPWITLQPQSQAVLEGGSATFSVAASAAPAPAYYWLRDSTPIAGATGSSYTIGIAQLVDSGSQFSCLASNAAGTAASRPALLTVMPGGGDHITWDTIGSPQVSNTPFGVRLTARDALGNVVSNFSGAVSLNGVATEGTVLFSAGFEGGNLDGWADEGGGYTFRVSEGTAPAGRRSLALIGGDLRSCDGLSHSFTNLAPDRVNFWVRAANADLLGGYFVIGQDKYRSNSVAYFYMYRDGTMGLVSSDGQSYLASAFYEPNRWYKVSLGLNWAAKTIDFYLDDVRLQEGVCFCNTNIDSIAMLNLGNFEFTQVWYDQIEFLQGGVSTPASCLPSVTGNFTNGVWAGNLLVPQATASLVLKATDGSGHVGLSMPFEVTDQSASPPTLTAPLLVGNGQFQFTLAGTPGCAYEIQVSTNLQSWTLWRNLTITGSTTNLIDTSMGPGPLFYRARLVR